MRASRSVSVGRWTARRTKKVQMVGQEQRDPTVAFPQRFDADPHDLAGRDQSIEIRRRVALNARRQDLAFELGGGDWRSLKRFHGIEDRVEAATAWPGDGLPGQREPAQRALFDRLHLFSQPRERPLPQRAKDVGATPFALEATGPELSLHHAPVGGKARQRLFDHRDAKTESCRALRARERAVRARVALHHVACRVGYPLQQRVRQLLRHAGARAYRGIAPHPRRR